MSRLFSIGEVSDLAGVTSKTLKSWENDHLIPAGTRVGLGKVRVWNEGQVNLILAFASGNGHSVTLPSECY